MTSGDVVMAGVVLLSVLSIFWARDISRWEQTGRWEWRLVQTLPDGRRVERHYYEVYDRTGRDEPRWRAYRPYWSEDGSLEERVVAAPSISDMK